MFKIEKNVPLPQNFHGTARKYPFHQMQVGDSFLVKVDPQTQISYLRAQNRVGAALSCYCKGPYSGRFIVRKVKDENGIRVWRIK